VIRRLLVILILLVLCGFSSCIEPVGYIDSNGNGIGNGSGSQYEFLMLRPNRILYDVNSGADSRFSRQQDLSVFLADNGEFKKIETSDSGLILEVIENPGLNSETITVVNNGYYVFSIPGRYLIRGTYNEKSDEYSVEVRGSFINPGEGSDFVDIIWL